MTGRFGFDVDELGPTEGNELENAFEAIGALQRVAEEAPVRTGPAFTNRVMAALTDEPAPGAVGFLGPLRDRGIFRGFGASVRQAWASLGTGRPTFARAAALAYVLVVALAGTSLVAAASFGAAGALGLLEPHQTVGPTPSPTFTPSQMPEPTIASPEPTESPEIVEPSDDRGGVGEPEPTDDRAGNAGPGSGGDRSDDGSGGGSGGSGGDSGGPDDGSGSRETDDHSGSDDGSGSGGGSDDGSSSGSSGDSAGGAGTTSPSYE